MSFLAARGGMAFPGAFRADRKCSMPFGVEQVRHRRA